SGDPDPQSHPLSYPRMDARREVVRILIVEDEATTGEYLAKGLREAAYTVECVANGREALGLATGESFDAIILDRNLPGLDGLSVLQALRAASVETPVLILSALGAPE